MDGPPRPGPRPPPLACSCDVLRTLVARDPALGVLRAHGVDPSRLLASVADVHAAAPSEPTHWRLRLPEIGKDDDLQALLAICRSADSHGYRALDQAGLDCSSLRRAVLDAVRRRPGKQVPRAEAMRSRPLASATTPARVRAPIAPGPRSPRRLKADVGDRTAPRADPRATEPIPDAAAIPAQPEPTLEPVLHLGPAAVLTPIRAADLPALHGRAHELARLADAIDRASPRPTLLVGPPGSGRTIVAKHLARALGRSVFRLSAPDYDDPETTLAPHLREIASKKGIAILDDVDYLASEAPPPWLPTLVQAWVRHEPKLVVVASPEGHARLSAWMPAVLESTEPIRIESLAGDALHDAVVAAAPAILAAHRVEMATDFKLVEVVRLADRWLGGLAMPARALDLLDLSCARTRREGRRVVARACVHEIVAEKSGLPLARIASTRGDQDALELEPRLAAQVVGHGEAIKAIAELVRRNRAGFAGGRPICSTLLLGPSGVGKTELAKALASALLGREDALVRLDMSEYAEPHAVARLVGAPPGYVGHEHGGVLSDPLVARPHTVVLLDEIEKAHRDVHLLLLQVLDEGRLTDGRGRTVDFRHAAVLMTSNLGADRITVAGGRARADEAAVIEQARGAFPIELWNRIEAVLVMQPLSDDELARIGRRMVKHGSERLQRERGIRYELSEAGLAHLVARAGRDPRLGARPLRHLVTRDLESLVADAVLRGKVRAGGSVTVDVEGQRLVVR
jgi:ATP-dependent Clp protease ATP-binding subunit ClpC